MQRYFISLFVALLVGGGGYLLLNTESQTQLGIAASQSGVQQSLEEYVEARQPAQEYTSEEFLATQGAFLPYFEQNIGRLADEKTVLFFGATWCPTCQIAKKNFSENANNFPAGLTVLDVDYDSNKDLRVKYGVTLQHTFVQIDPTGNELKKWSGSYIINQIIDQIEG